MAQKGKQIIWHKRKGKIIPSKFSKVSGKKPKTDNCGEDTGDKMSDFVRRLKAQIKKAASGEDNR